MNNEFFKWIEKAYDEIDDLNLKISCQTEKEKDDHALYVVDLMIACLDLYRTRGELSIREMLNVDTVKADKDWLMFVLLLYYNASPSAIEDAVLSRLAVGDGAYYGYDRLEFLIKATYAYGIASREDIEITKIRINSLLRVKKADCGNEGLSMSTDFSFITKDELDEMLGR